MSATEISETKSCIVCGIDVIPSLDLGRQPFANALLDARDAPYVDYPLAFAQCPNCAHGQLTHFADPSDIFVDYLYASGTSQTLKDFFTWFAGRVTASLGTDVAVLELASNDGSLLDAFRAAGLDPMGIDPARNLCEEAEAKGHRVKCGFFPDVKPDGLVDLIVAMNVTAHTPNPRAFVQGMSDVLSPGGMAVIQTSQANMIANGEFDTIYHEHYSFFSAPSMKALAESAGLTLERIELVSVHGTSFLFTLRKPGGSPKVIDFADTAEGTFFVPMPDPLPDLFQQDCPPDVAAAAFDTFVKEARAKMVTTADLLRSHTDQGKTLGLVGVAAKALTFVKAAGIDPHYYFDEAPLKVGRFVPGAPTAIQRLAAMADMDEDLVLLIGAWNFADELTRKMREIVKGTPMEHRLTLIVHQPDLREL